VAAHRKLCVRCIGIVVPSAKDGLHCGCDAIVVWAEHACVVPSAKDGLHCGVAAVAVERFDEAVVPSAKDGLHCGLKMPGLPPPV